MFKPAFITTLFITIITLFSSPLQANKTHFGTHGMTIFGGDDGLFASHLPMYHKPHNVQMVMQFHFSDPDIDKTVKQKLTQQSNQANQLWTIVPKPFDLMRLHPSQDNELTKLQVDVVEGHFERGGISRFTDQEVIIDNIIIFSELNMLTEQNKAANATYQVISANPQSQHQFLVKLIENRPEADHLLRVLNHQFDKVSQVTVPLKGKLHPSKDELAKNLSLAPQQLIEIYLETAELQ
ncbi:hypothetical protein L2735_10970 [Shewanella olleyana]|uniref:hypothetical protein n=1 Tax=Shewanella olleyana TaxID=135626 RepID=UPI00200EF01E|nr:hypothetical protein [Shewanella olleyana]MCL1067326.1 hypothetical protein [Shewanella olleyana]